MPISFFINGKAIQSNAPSDTPLLWVIREEVKLTGTKFGCGAGLCGACMVHIDGRRAFSCQTQLSELTGARRSRQLKAFPRIRLIPCSGLGLRNACHSAATASLARS